MKRKSSARKTKKRKSAKERKHGLASVVIPTVNQTEMVKDCMLALKANTGNFPYEIIIVDDGSEKNVQDYLKNLAANFNFKLILKDKNEGFSKTCNRGINEAKGDYVLLLNNDVFVEPGWLKALLKVAERDEKVGIVGGRLLYPDGTIQHAGIFFSPQTSFEHRFRFYDKNYFQALQQVEVIGVTFALAMISRKVIDQIGLLDESFFVSFEDVDYCLRTLQAGFKIVYCPQCVATHLEGATRGRFLYEKDPYWLKKEIDTLDTFFKKWVNYDLSQKSTELIYFNEFCHNWINFNVLPPELI